MIETLTCIRCGRRTKRERVRGPKPLRCAECTREADLERFRKAQRIREAARRRGRPFGDGTRAVESKAVEVAEKLASMPEDERLAVAHQLIELFDVSLDEMSWLLATAQDQAEAS